MLQLLLGINLGSNESVLASASQLGLSRIGARSQGVFADQAFIKNLTNRCQYLRRNTA